MMDAAMIRAIDISLGSGLTSQLVDRKRAVMAIRSAQNDADRLVVMELVLDKRAVHRTWLTITQRRWQRSTRHMRQRTIKAYAFRAGGIERAPARVQESIDTRERYVRCQ